VRRASTLLCLCSLRTGLCLSSWPCSGCPSAGGGHARLGPKQHLLQLLGPLAALRQMARTGVRRHFRRSALSVRQAPAPKPRLHALLLYRGALTAPEHCCDCEKSSPALVALVPLGLPWRRTLAHCNLSEVIPTAPLLLLSNLTHL